MASWLRLWHDMPTDPKWRVIAKRSGQSISGFYKDWCWFQDEYKFRLSLGALNEFLGFDRNPPKLTDEELDEIWREIISG